MHATVQFKFDVLHFVISGIDAAVPFEFDMLYSVISGTCSLLLPQHQSSVAALSRSPLPDRLRQLLGSRNDASRSDERPGVRVWC